MASGIRRVRISFDGGTEEERTALTDIIVMVLIEHGINVQGMRSWDGPENSEPPDNR